MGSGHLGTLAAHWPFGVGYLACPHDPWLVGIHIQVWMDVEVWIPYDSRVDPVCMLTELRVYRVDPVWFPSGSLEFAVWIHLSA